MMNKEFLSKKNIEVGTRILGLICLFFVINKQIFKSNSNPSTQDIQFLISIWGIIFLSISLNFKVKVTEENPNFYQRNTPLIFGLSIAFFLSLFFVCNNI